MTEKVNFANKISPDENEEPSSNGNINFDIEETVIYPHVIPEINDWPIKELSDDRDAFVQQIEDYTIRNMMTRPTEKLAEMIEKTIYLERIRIKEEPWKVDPPDEKSFWSKVRKNLIKLPPEADDNERRAVYENILRRIVGRYSEEIVGTFNKNTFLFARKFLTGFFGRLLNTAASRNFKRFYERKFQLYDRLKLTGELESVRKLFTKGTVVLVPTHFSNLDSILIGYAIDSILGLPSFSYGAGLNLYNTGYTAYYMNRLGAYRIDRRKKNPIYLETLKSMSNLSIQRGTNSLFFPGGTRSRSGAMETKLKKGMLGTAVEAQRALYQKGTDDQIFIVPLVLSYNFVLEAKFMIDGYLKKTGKERFIKTKDASLSARSAFKFLWQLFSRSNDIHLSFGRPMDVMGNFVNDDGESFDKWGNKINIKEYFVTDGEIKTDFQREAEYTNLLSNKLVERYKEENVVLASQVVAYCAFKVFQQKNKGLDIYALLRLANDDFVFEEEELLKSIKSLQEKLFAMEKEGKIRLSYRLRFSPEKVLVEGINRMGSFHIKDPLKYHKKTKDIVSEDFYVLYYYHNRLAGYGF